MSENSLSSQHLPKKLSEVIKWLFWDFSGLRFIYEKIRPPLSATINKRPPATFFLWLIGIYVALFGVALQRFESKVDAIKDQRKATLMLMEMHEIRKGAMSQIPGIQEMKCPQKPDFLNPIVTFKSLFGQGHVHNETIMILKNVVEKFNKDLSEVKLAGANLREADLRGANLEEADLSNADLRMADLREANLEKANLFGAKLRKANLSRAKLKMAVLMGSDLQEANLIEAELQEAMLGSIAQIPGSEHARTGPAADLRKASLNKADLEGANLIRANLKEAKLKGASLKAAILFEANLEGANFDVLYTPSPSSKGLPPRATNFQDAILEGVNLQGAEDLDIGDLSRAKTLYTAKLDAKNKESIDTDYPGLLAKEVPWGLSSQFEHMVRKYLTQKTELGTTAP